MLTRVVSRPPAISQLRALPPPAKTLSSGSQLWRVYCEGGKYPSQWNVFRDFGPVPSGRFDHHFSPPQKQVRRILYCAEKIPTTLAEVFQDTRVIDPHDSDRHLVSFRLISDLELIDLTNDAWLRAIGAPSDLCQASRERAQEWSRAFYEAYPAMGGIYYRSSRHNQGRNVALYERAATTLPHQPVFHRSLQDRDLRPTLESAVEQLEGYDLLPAQ